jgi:hypothetical protein
MSICIKCTDHLGNEFDSKAEMTRYWGISTGTLLSRERYGWDLEKILTTPPSKRYVVKDHLGNEFKNRTEMYKFWKVDSRTASAREKLGWSVEKILTEPIQTHDAVKDHLGNVFENETEMAKYYGLEQRDIYARRKRGWDLEKILTTPKAVIHTECVDHLGNKFKSYNDMYKHYGIDKKIARNRIKLGWSLEKILTEPVFEPNKYKDPVTGEMLTIKELSDKYGIAFDALRDRIKGNYSMASVVGISIFIRSRHMQINQSKYGLLVHRRIQKDKDVFECYIDNGDDTSTFKIMTYDMIDQYCLEQYKKLHNGGNK